MRNIWSWAVTLGAVFWVVSLVAMFWFPVEFLVKILNYLMESVALVVGLVYVIIEVRRLINKKWKIIWAELGIMLMVVLLSWGILSVFAYLILESDRYVIEKIIGELVINDVRDIGDWTKLLWIPKMLLRMMLTMIFPVVVVKIVLRVVVDLKLSIKKKSAR